MENIKEFEQLIYKRISCKLCHESNRMCHFEKFFDETDEKLLGLWDPLHFGNLLCSEILIIGQDYSNVDYLEKAKRSREQLYIQEEKSPTNKKIRRYLNKVEWKEKPIYFTNAVLCIKFGTMSAKIDRKWVENCSEEFLKPLIAEYLTNLRTIITLGEGALSAIKYLDLNTINKPFKNVVAKPQLVKIDQKPYKLIPMYHPACHLDVVRKSTGKEPEEIWRSIKL